MKIAFFLLGIVIFASCGPNDPVQKKNAQNLKSTHIPPSESDKGRGIDDTSQEKEKIETAIPKNNDTIFIKRELSEDMYHAIYIEKQKNTQRFKWLTNFSFNESDIEGYKSAKEYYKEKYPLAYKTKVNTFSLPKNWIPVHKYKNQYYTYAPSDWGNTGQRTINNQEFIQMNMDGPNPNPIESSEKINSKKVEFTLFGGDIVRVYLFDPKQRIYIFEIDNGNSGSYYGFYVPSQYASNFDMIVNYCQTQKQHEYHFEEVDFEALIEKIK